MNSSNSGSKGVGEVGAVALGDRRDLLTALLRGEVIDTYEYVSFGKV